MAPSGWPRLELRYLAALEAIAATGSFGAAADRLGYTQSAISQQIAALERLVGQPLIERPGGRRPVGLTAAGRSLRGHAESILTRARLAQADLDALAEGAAGRLRVGTVQSTGVRILPGAAARLAELHPDVDLEIHEASDDLALLDSLRDGALDLAFAELPVPPGAFATRALLDDPYVLLVPAGSPLANGNLGIGELATAPLIGYRSCRTCERVEAYLRGVGIDLKRAAYADDNAIIQAMVREGQGVALMTRLSIDETDPGTEAVRLDELVPARRLALAWHAERGLGVAGEAFVAAAAEVARAEAVSLSAA